MLENKNETLRPVGERPREGDLYKTVSVFGEDFELRYGYYDPELERGKIEPTLIYPNFKEKPLYTDDGVPFVMADQDICEHFLPKPKISSEGWCNDCLHMEKHEEFIGLCRCELRRIKSKQVTKA